MRVLFEFIFKIVAFIILFWFVLIKVELSLKNKIHVYKRDKTGLSIKKKSLKFNETK
jgi:hypothetical protein